MNAAATETPRPESIGIIVVHGIGEQRRFEHLDWQGRDIIRAIKEQPGVEITVEIAASPAANFHAEQDTWDGGPSGPVQVFVRTNGQFTHCLHFHEVWWADVNERYSLAKQLRFWLWGLAVWSYPTGTGAKLHGTDAVTSPNVPGQRVILNRLWQRTRLFMVGVFFLVAAFPIGIGLLLIQRLLNLKTPDLLKTATNYVSGVKLFNQRSRFGPGFCFRPPNEDFLDTLDEPPRVSVRRRIVRTIAVVAQADYDCWYIVAHSQGTVPALNGLMETPYAWPGYFDEATWRTFCAAGLGGPGNVPAVVGATMPQRPVWARPNEVAYRGRIFQRFRGLLTLGSPIEKFATIWPARVPIARIPAFRENTVWINVFDPLDPVSGVMNGYDGHPTAVCPTPKNVGYAASLVLLLAHLRYVTWSGTGCLADAVAKWLLTGNPDSIRTDGDHCFEPGSRQAKRRTAVAWAWWLAVFVVLGIAGGRTVRAVLSRPIASSLCDCPPLAASPLTIGAKIVAAWHWFWPSNLPCYVLGVVTFAFVGTLLVGGLSHWLLFRGDKDPPAPDTEGELRTDVDPEPPALPPW